MTEVALNDLSVLDMGMSDPDGDTVTLYEINGVVQDWGTVPKVITTLQGTLRIYAANIKAPYAPAPGPFARSITWEESGNGKPKVGQTIDVFLFRFRTIDPGGLIGPEKVCSIKLTGVSASPPPAQLVNTVAPAISGTTTVGNVLTCTDGTWTGNGTVTVTGRQWLRDGVAIAGATNNTYTSVAGDVGKQISCRISVQDTTPSTASATAAAVGITPVDLANTAVPTIQGTAIQGQTLSLLAQGTWLGTGTINRTYKWQRNGVDIGGATSTSYTLVLADVGTQVRLVELATDDLAGPTPAYSVSVTVAATGADNYAAAEAAVLAEFATSPDKGWAGFTDTTGFTVVSCANIAAVKAAWDAWAAGTPATSKLLIEMAWDGPSSGAATQWNGPAAAKLTSYAGGTMHVGANGTTYDLPPGGVWIRPAAGRSPIVDQQIIITGATRLHLEGWRQGPKKGANGQTSSYFQLNSAAGFPLGGAVYLEGCNFGLMENQSSWIYDDIWAGPIIEDYYSLRIERCRVTASKKAWRPRVRYLWTYWLDAQQLLDDMMYSTAPGFPGLAGQILWAYHDLWLVRDFHQDARAQGFHTDTLQHGHGGDTNAGYRTVAKRILAYMNSYTAFDSESQAFYNDDSPNSVAMSMSVKDCIVAYNAYWGFVRYDFGGAGKWNMENTMLLRSGRTYQGADTFPRARNFHPPNTGLGGSFNIRNSVMAAAVTNATAGVVIDSNTRYVDPRSTVPAGRNGLTAGTSMRMEEYISGAGGSFSRDGNNFLTYTIPGETSTDFATAFWALVDFFEPIAGYGNTAGPSDPETWPDAPARPGGGPVITGNYGVFLDGQSNLEWVVAPDSQYNVAAVPHPPIIHSATHYFVGRAGTGTLRDWQITDALLDNGSINKGVGMISATIGYAYPDVTLTIGEGSVVGTGRNQRAAAADAERPWSQEQATIDAFEIRNGGPAHLLLEVVWTANDGAAIPTFLEEFSAHYFGQNTDGSAFTLGTVPVTPGYTRRYPTDQVHQCMYDVEAASAAVKGRGIFPRTTKFIYLAAGESSIERGGLNRFNDDPRMDLMRGVEAAQWGTGDMRNSTNGDWGGGHAYNGDESQMYCGVPITETIIRQMDPSMRPCRIPDISFAPDGSYVEVTFDLGSGNDLQTIASLEGRTLDYANFPTVQDWYGLFFMRVGDGQFFTPTRTGTTGGLYWVSTLYNATPTKVAANKLRWTPEVPFNPGDTVMWRAPNQDYNNSGSFTPHGNAARHWLSLPFAVVPALRDPALPVWARFPGFQPLWEKGHSAVYQAPADPTSDFTHAATGPGFLDPNNLPANTKIFEFEWQFFWDLDVPKFNGTKYFLEQANNGFRFSYTSGNQNIAFALTTAQVAGPVTVRNFTAPACWSRILRNRWNTVAAYINCNTGLIGFRLNNSAWETYPFIAGVGGVLRSDRKVSFFGTQTGGSIVPAGVRTGYMEAYVTNNLGVRSLLKRIGGTAAQVNSEPANPSGWRIAATGNAL